MKLRLSDLTAHAVEFEAVDLASFKTALHSALLTYRDLFTSPRPHLHVWGGQWVDAGYGRGTHIVLHDNIFEDAAYLVEIWERCESASANVVAFKKFVGQMVGAVSREVRKPQLRVVDRDETE